MFGFIDPEILLNLSEMADDENIKIHISTAQCQGSRLSQEDRFITMNMNYGWLAVVCDGHGLPDATENVILNVANIIHAEYRTAIDKDEKKIFRRVFKKLHELTCDLENGTTVSLVLVKPIDRDINNQRQLRATLVSLGDSPLSLLDGGKYTHMPMHTAQFCAVDQRRIEKNKSGHIEGGYLYSNNLHPRAGGIAITRSLGDKKFDSVLSRLPAIKCFDISTEAVIVLASDGILKSAEPHKVKATMRDVIKKVKNGFSAEDILNADDGTRDNATLITMHFKE